MLTGTPLQNDLQELQNLLGFLLPDVFKDDAAAHLANVQVGLWCLLLPWSSLWLHTPTCLSHTGVDVLHLPIRVMMKELLLKSIPL